MSPLEKLHFGKKSLGLWLTLTKEYGSVVKAFNNSNIHEAYQHYPSEDILSNSRSLQYFYHSHRDTGEHGHIHIFHKTLNSSDTNHLLAIGLSEKGLPISLFTIDAVSVNEKPAAPEMLKQFLNQSLRNSHKETALTDWIIAFCTFYKSDIIKLFLNKDNNPKADYCDSDICSFRPINWEEDLEDSEKMHHNIAYENRLFKNSSI